MGTGPQMAGKYGILKESIVVQFLKFGWKD
jgi:hypothetical protein